MILAILFIIQLFLLEKYLISNLTLYGTEHTGLIWLFLYIIFAITSSLIYFMNSRKISLRISVGLLVLFFLYFIYRCAIDLAYQDWTSKFIGSDAGIIYYFIFGFLVSSPISFMINKGYSNTQPIIFFKMGILFFTILTTIDSFNLVLLALKSSREDLFLLEVGDSLYQWPGDLISIRTLILTMFSAYLISYRGGGLTIVLSGL